MTELPGGDEINSPVLNNFYQFVVLSLLLCWLPSCSLSPASPGRHGGNQGGSPSLGELRARAWLSSHGIPLLLLLEHQRLQNILLGYIPWCSSLKKPQFLSNQELPPRLPAPSSWPSSTPVFAVGTYSINIFMFKHSKDDMGSLSFSVQELRETPPKKIYKEKINFSSRMQTRYLARGTEWNNSYLRNLVYFFQLIEFIKALFFSVIEE